VLEEADRLASGDDPVAALEFMTSRRFKRLPRELVGPGGPLHGRLLAVTFKLKEKVVQAESGVRKVERNWEHLPSMALIPVGRTVNSREIIEAARTSGQDLICLMPYGADSSHSRRQLDLSYEFADDPRLALMLLGFNGCILIRASFLVNFASDVQTDSLQDFVQHLPERMERHGMYLKHVER
jgi:hypothetical protein